MRDKSHFTDYEPVTRTRQASLREAERAPEDWPRPYGRETAEDGFTDNHAAAGATEHPPPGSARAGSEPSWILRRGHALSYLGLFLFTAVLYFRPYELIPALSSFNNMAFVVAVATLIIFFPTQLALEGTLTARPREVNFLLLFCLIALLSITFAIDPGMAWDTFSGNFIKAVLMFVVMINSVRTQRRLKALILLALFVSFVLSVGALQDYYSGNLAVESYRVAGRIGGLFDNPNDLALHLVTMIPVAVALLLGARGVAAKLAYGVCAAPMLAAPPVTVLRGGV